MFRKTSIKRKQTLIIMITSGAALLLACLAFATYDIVTFRRGMIADASMLTEVIGNTSTAALDFNDPRSAQETLSALKAEPDVVHAAIYNKLGEVFAVYQRHGNEPLFTPPPVRTPGFIFSDNAIRFYRPISSKGEVIGTVYVERDLRSLYSRLRQYIFIVAGVFSAATLVAFVLSAQLQRIISGPILHLVETARVVAREQDFSRRALRQSEDELGVLVDSFNEMLTQIQHRDAELQKARELLELRVQERTCELQQRTVELREEVVQHKNTEEALAVSESLMVSLVETLPQNVLRKDFAGRFTFVNGVFCRTVGKSKEDIIGKTDFDLFPAEMAAKFSRDDEQVIANGKAFETEEENCTADGEKVYVQVIKTPLCNAERKPIGLQVIFWDVTPRKKAEQALRAQEERTRSIIDQAFDSVVTMDIDAKIIGWNRQAEATFGWPQTHVMGRNFIDTLVLPERREEGKADFEFFRKTGQWRLDHRLYETTGYHQDGHEIPVEVNITPILVGNSYILNAFIRDISARKRAEANLEQVHKQLVAASRQAGMAEIATSVLHNVGNVLNSINVTATVVEERVRKSRTVDLNRLVKLLGDHKTDLGTFLTLDERGRKVPEFLVQLANRLAAEQTSVLAELASLRKNVEHVKDIVAMQQNYAKISGVIESIDVADLIEDSLRMNAGTLARHEVELVREICTVPPIRTDKHKVLQILINLVRNAQFACDESRRTEKQVIVRVNDGGECVRISVIDNGVGIPPENLTRIFNHGFTTRKNGHGFGLHSGALAAKELGGSLIAQSDGCGRGASFTLELPKTCFSAEGNHSKSTQESD